MSYVDDAYYEKLVSDFSPFNGEFIAGDDTRVRDCEALLYREARLLDQNRFADWLGLFAPQCLYWIPGTAPAGDPRREVAVALDDRRRLEDRVFRLGTGAAWSQAPASRTVRMVGNVELFERGAALLARSTLLVSELRAGETRLWSAWCAHRLRRDGDGWRIEVKQVNLIDADQNLRNPSLLL